MVGRNMNQLRASRYSPCHRNCSQYSLKPLAEMYRLIRVKSRLLPPLLARQPMIQMQQPCERALRHRDLLETRLLARTSAALTAVVVLCADSELNWFRVP